MVCSGRHDFDEPPSHFEDESSAAFLTGVADFGEVLHGASVSFDDLRAIDGDDVEVALRQAADALEIGRHNGRHLLGG